MVYAGDGRCGDAPEEGPLALLPHHGDLHPGGDLLTVFTRAVGEDQANRLLRPAELRPGLGGSGFLLQDSGPAGALVYPFCHRYACLSAQMGEGWGVGESCTVFWRRFWLLLPVTPPRGA